LELKNQYLAGFVVLVIASGGLFSLDTLAFSNPTRSRIQKNSWEEGFSSLRLSRPAARHKF
jgi:hypothetical protein